MKVLILYRPKSEYSRSVETFLHDFGQQHPDGNVETVDVDSREGADLASLYDIMQFPAVLAISDDGSLLKGWIGEMLPAMDEVAYYTQT